MAGRTVGTAGGFVAALVVLGVLGLDLTDPLVTTHFPGTLPAGEPALLEATVTDASGISSAILVLDHEGGLPQAYVMHPSGTSRWAASIPAQTPGSSTAIVSATDANGRTASSSAWALTFVTPTLDAAGAPPAPVTPETVSDDVEDLESTVNAPSLAETPAPPSPDDALGTLPDEVGDIASGSSPPSTPAPDGDDDDDDDGNATLPDPPATGEEGLDDVVPDLDDDAGGNAPRDAAPPRFTQRSPAPDSSTDERRPALRVSYEDGGGIDVASVAMTLDGSPLRPGATEAGAVAVLSRDLSVGEHEVFVSVADAKGNVATTRWRFTVSEHATTRPLAPFSLVALPLAGESANALSLAPLRFAGGEDSRPVVRPLDPVPAIPPGLELVAAFDLAPETPGSGSAVVELRLDESWARARDIDASKLLLLHHVSGDWAVHALEEAGSDDGALALVAAVPSFSPFALVVDRVAPALEMDSALDGFDSADVLVARVMIADASGTIPGELLLDGEPVDGVSRRSGQLVAALGPLEPGTHTVTATGTDLVGNVGRETWTFVVEQASAAKGALSQDGEDAEGEGASPDAVAEDTEQRQRLTRGLLGALFVGAAGIVALARVLTRPRQVGKAGAKTPRRP